MAADPYGYHIVTPGYTIVPNPAPTKPATNGTGATATGPAAATPTVSGTGIGTLAVAGLGAIALSGTKVGPVIIAALVAAVIWNGNALVGVIGGKASGISLGGAAATSAPVGSISNPNPQATATVPGSAFLP